MTDYEMKLNELLVANTYEPEETRYNLKEFIEFDAQRTGLTREDVIDAINKCVSTEIITITEAYALILETSLPFTQQKSEELIREYDNEWIGEIKNEESL